MAIITLAGSIVALMVGQGVTKDLGTLDKPVSWDTLEARYKCGPKESKPDCVTRLRDALVKELAKPKLALAMPSLVCRDESKRQRCAVTMDGCMPLSGLIVNALVTDLPGAVRALKVNADDSLELLTDDASTGSNCPDGLRVRFEPGATEFSFVP